MEADSRSDETDANSHFGFEDFVYHWEADKRGGETLPLSEFIEARLSQRGLRRERLDRAFDASRPPDRHR